MLLNENTMPDNTDLTLTDAQLAIYARFADASTQAMAAECIRSRAALKLSDHDKETLRLAAEYKAACDAVQPAWIAMLRTGAGSYERTKEAAPAYRAASAHAQERHRVLITHVSCGVFELGT